MRNEAVTVTPSSSKAVASLNVALNNPDSKALDLVIDVTDAGAAGSLAVTIQGVDPTSAKKYTILASAAITAVGTTVLRVGPALTASANAVANFNVPRQLNILAAVTVNAMTFSIGANLIGG